MLKVICIIGPTGVGKTKTSIELAKMLNTEIISGDSMQIYRGMDIGTAKVTNEEAEGIVHHQIDILDVDQGYSVYEFQQNTRRLIKEINDQGKIPIICGGTGFYIKATLFDYVFDSEETDTTNRSEFIKRYQHLSNDDLHDLLKEVDPKSAEKNHPNNRRRVQRALEYYETHHKPMSAEVDKQEHEMIYDAHIIGLNLAREKLYDRINSRVDVMVENGLIEEVKSFFDQGYSKELQSMQGIGYKELYPYFEGNMDLNDCLNRIKQLSRNYAKKQFTWFNNQMSVNWYDVNLEDFDQTVSLIKEDVIKLIK
jgi:tRNA dimethylallyltransferase